MAEEIGISVKDKFCLTIEEASRYFGIGEKKLRKLVNSNLDAGFVIQNGEIGRASCRERVLLLV